MRAALGDESRPAAILADPRIEAQPDRFPFLAELRIIEDLGGEVSARTVCAALTWRSIARELSTPTTR